MSGGAGFSNWAKQHYNFAVSLIFLGWIFNVIAWSIAGPHPVNTFFLLVGVLGILGGLIWMFVIWVNNK